MAGLYKNGKDLMADVILASSTKGFSVSNDGKCVLPTKLDIELHREDRAVATARIAINRAMTQTE
jgi:hypothetical protein